MIDAVNSGAGPTGGTRKIVTALAESHMAEVRAWFDEQAAAGRITPVYRAEIAFGVNVAAEVVCVR